jgi:mono/diheme cytochrome c family protein
MRRSTLAALVALALGLGLLAAGCLDGDEQTATAETVVGTLPQSTTSTEDRPALALEGDAAAGKEIFTPSCGGCHTLADAGTSGAVGPNLDEAQTPLETVVARVTNGQGAMPAFEDQLDDQQIADVSAYVVQATGAG